MKTAKDVLKWCGDRDIRIDPETFVWHWMAGTLWLAMYDQGGDSDLFDTREGYAEVVRTHRDDGSSISCFELKEEIPVETAPTAFQKKYRDYLANKSSAQTERLTEIFKLARSTIGASPGHQLVELAASIASGLTKTDIARCKIEAGKLAETKEVESEIDLIKAIVSGNIEAIAMADETVEYDINSNFSPLIIATICGSSKMVGTLIEKGADVNLEGLYRGSALNYAAYTRSNERTQIIKQLIDAGAEIDVRDNDWQTPLHAAAINDYSDVVQLLIDAGADIDAADDSEDTVLHHAVYSGKPSTVALLIKSGVRLNCKNSRGLTPLAYAKWKGLTELTELLIQAGAKDSN